MTQKDKIYIGVFGAIALLNFYLQYRSSKKMQEIKDEIVKSAK